MADIITQTEQIRTGIVIAKLQSDNLKVCQALGLIPPSLSTGLAQHAASVQAAKDAAASKLLGATR